MSGVNARKLNKCSPEIEALWYVIYTLGKLRHF